MQFHTPRHPQRDVSAQLFARYKDNSIIFMTDVLLIQTFLYTT